ncbi:MAG: hypothetical protein B7X39_04145 [Lysobacterales bacterium 14-68-21]|jgi:peptidoglycan hydrolase-like protein with peptidoglycan-binding domain|nr:MAG: hypothetical protein B7X45_00655 [Xanthomonadales bacterium 15-68-25]OZB67740.1 MAG: hypothetical protein B7X39_04145 [Xanthomonadales bacterium 14-68-21]
MSRYTISESVGSRMLPVHSYEDLHKHHPSSGREPNRQYGTVHGELEEIRRVDGRVFVKKDFVLAQDVPGPVEIPAPVAGYAHFLHDAWNTVQIYDKPYGTPGAQREGQVLHMVRGSSPFGEGDPIRYGQPLGEMGQTGSPGSIHAHVELEVGQFERYIRDINNGTIRPGIIPRDGPGGTEALLGEGSRGADVTQLQRKLGQLGYTGTGQTPLAADGVFGADTLHAVQAFQRDHALGVDGKAGPLTDAALDGALAAHRTAGLQSGLNRLGYTGSDGRPLQVDGDFGAQTRFAVEAFQRDHHLSIDGKVGPRTQGALNAALTHRAQASAAPTNLLLSDPGNPDNPLYRQALAQVRKIDADMGRPSDEHSERLAAALVPVAKAHGLTRIDAVALSDDGSRTFVAEDTTPIRRMAEVSTAEAVRTPIEQSSAEAREVQVQAPPTATPVAGQTVMPARPGGDAPPATTLMA